MIMRPLDIMLRNLDFYLGGKRGDNLYLEMITLIIAVVYPGFVGPDTCTTWGSPFKKNLI